MIQRPTHLYTALAGIFLLLQGTSTLAFRQFPALDRAFPALLEITRMMPAHSLLHIISGLLAVSILRWGGARGAFWFAAGFGLFYVGLGFVGMFTDHAAMLHMQPFDHGFHIVLGGLGMCAVGVEVRRSRCAKQAAP